MNCCVCTGPGLTIAGLTFSLSFKVALEWEEVMGVENSLGEKKGWGKRIAFISRV